MKRLRMYETSMCCPTGLCGVSVDPELLRISAMFDKLAKADIQAERYNLSGAPMEFIKNGEVNKIIGEHGVGILPLTVVDDEIVLTGRYPSNEEIKRFLDLPQELFTA
ncbi:MAG TPA: arsenite efflux transporter metallochaperone ArsD [Desulfuromonadaceae bacterium]